MFLKFQFYIKFRKISKFFIILEKSQFYSKFLKISILMKIFAKISISATFDEKSLF